MSDNTQQEKNRKVVYNLITTNYYNSNNPETYDVWFAKWFANENTFSKGKNSLFDFLFIPLKLLVVLSVIRFLIF